FELSVHVHPLRERIVGLDADPGAGSDAAQQRQAEQNLTDVSHDPCSSTTVPARMRQTSSAKSMPAALAAMGTSEWLVMPGTVLTSRNQGWPSRSSMKSNRPQPRPPTMSKACLHKRCNSSSRSWSSPLGQ